MVVLDINLAMMHGHIFLYNVKANAAADVFAIGFLLVEPVEDSFLVFFLDADACVGYFQMHHRLVVSFSADGNRDSSPRCIILKGIRQKIHHDAPHFILVEIHLHAGRIDLHVHGNTPIVGIVFEVINDFPQEFYEVAMRKMQLLGTCIKPTEVEQLAHAILQEPGIAPHQFQLCAQRLVEITVEQFFERRDDECEWRLQVVAYIGEESHLVLLHLVLLLQFQLECLHGQRLAVLLLQALHVKPHGHACKYEIEYKGRP